MNKLWFIFNFSQDNTKFSGGANLSLSWVSLIFSPVNETTGRVASWEASESGITVEVLSELGLKIEKESFGVWFEEARTIEDENKRDGCWGKWFTKTIFLKM